MNDGFLSRWARRKRDVRRSERSAAPVEAEVTPQSVEGVEALANTTEAVLTPEAEANLLADLPSLADLTAETDLIPFLRVGVPTAMRNAALRKMWSVDPAIRDFVSEAREYAYDWNTPGSVPGLGPLLQSDDVQAMLSRLFNREPDAANPSDPVVAPTTMPESEAPAGSDEMRALSAAIEQPPVVPYPEIQADRHTVLERPSATDVGAEATPRLRRHGGATPA